jgi:hypothetical protein
MPTMHAVPLSRLAESDTAGPSLKRCRYTVPPWYGNSENAVLTSFQNTGHGIGHERLSVTSTRQGINRPS